MILETLIFLAVLILGIIIQARVRNPRRWS